MPGNGLSTCWDSDWKDDMSKTKIIAAVAAASMIATIVSVTPAANAVQFEEQERAGRSICVATSTPNEIQITRNFFQAQLDRYDILQAELRDMLPEFAGYYTEFDRLTAEGHTTAYSGFAPGIIAIENAGYLQYEAQFFAAKATPVYKRLQELAQTGFPVTMEYAPGWTKAQMAAYPESDVPVVPIGGGLDSPGDFSRITGCIFGIDYWKTSYRSIHRGGKFSAEYADTPGTS